MNLPTHFPANQIPQIVFNPADSAQAEPEFKSNSPETLTLIANQLQAMLAKSLGPDTIYVLVIANPGKCNCISNAPVHKANQIRDIFRELSSRNVQLSQ